MVDPAYKLCGRCRFSKPTSAFHVNKAEPDGYRATCRACTNKAAKRLRFRHKQAALGIVDSRPTPEYQYKLENALTVIIRAFQVRLIDHHPLQVEGCMAPMKYALTYRKTRAGHEILVANTPQGVVEFKLDRHSVPYIANVLWKHNMDLIVGWRTPKGYAKLEEKLEKEGKKFEQD